ncbi:MAG TPA: hypothetical protein PLD37_03440 [Usitatibacteraceae bacterium]|nr:hypothetical protein [Usitatibacteraceae bacterium]
MGVPTVAPPDAGRERLPRGLGEIVETPDGLSIEFGRVDGEGIMPTLAMAVVFAGITLVGAWKSGAYLVIAVPFAAVVAWAVHGVMRGRHRRYRLEASPGGLVTCQGYGERLDRREIAKDDIDFIEPRHSLTIGDTKYFELIAELRGGERVVLCESVRGEVAVDLLVRRIGEVAQLHPEQALSAAASIRRRGAGLARLLSRLSRD